MTFRDNPSDGAIENEGPIIEHGASGMDSRPWVDWKSELLWFTLIFGVPFALLVTACAYTEVFLPVLFGL